MTLEQIRAALPTHIMLTPGVHRWREGDEIAVFGEDIWDLDWLKCERIIAENIEGKPVASYRRPIPPHILDNQAWWLFFNKACVDDKTNVYHVLQAYETYRRIMTLSNKAIQTLGGASIIAKYINEGRLYDKWLLEQMEEV